MAEVGLIVDSFGALRLDMEARENDQQTQTFVSCSLDEIGERCLDTPSGLYGSQRAHLKREVLRIPRRPVTFLLEQTLWERESR